ncbi:MAG: 30S ribosomal protein S17 [Gammaproteobacteria bacterium]|jgi:small subunit ribosomal protein S17|nr:30S ribosomal protein S17 [Gammaproteobacteria bacterium]
MTGENEKSGLTSRRTVTGRVTSDKMDKTIAVTIERLIKHPVYGKYIKRRTKVLAHDEENSCSVGDFVAIAECRPVSKHKSWKLVEIVEHANA